MDPDCLSLCGRYSVLRYDGASPPPNRSVSLDQNGTVKRLLRCTLVPLRPVHDLILEEAVLPVCRWDRCVSCPLLCTSHHACLGIRWCSQTWWCAAKGGSRLPWLLPSWRRPWTLLESTVASVDRELRLRKPHQMVRTRWVEVALT